MNVKEEQIFQMEPLFSEVQQQQVFADGKTFVDCIPKQDPGTILKKYEARKKQAGFDLKSFVTEHFELPRVFGSAYRSDKYEPVVHHIEGLWDVLTRNPDSSNPDSLLPLPYPYIVPGGRFGEIYYWDSYFTMLGLAVSGRVDMIENMVKNFSYLIDTIGYIPNGNRTYYIGRSQPPFYAQMVRLLSSVKGESVLADFLPQLEKEYAFWMRGAEELTAEHPVIKQVVRMPGGEILNRYFDELETPRPEAYREDQELAGKAKDPLVFSHLRAGAASGWDFSSRWFRDPGTFASIHTCDFVPVDLNSLLYNLEMTISQAYRFLADRSGAEKYQTLAAQRRKAIHEYCWHPERMSFVDYDMSNQGPADALTLASCFPLYFGMATMEQAAAIAWMLDEKFLRDGGLVTTLETTGQQWDAPNGWAPLQWIAIKGLSIYGHQELSEKIACRWIQLNDDVYHRTGKLMEKYNVVDTHLEAGGGEYPGQDGFGWTNGVLLALVRDYGMPATVNGSPAKETRKTE